MTAGGRRALIMAALAVSLATGCGDGDEVTATVERFQAALAAEDGRGACAELTPAARTAVAGEGKKPCERAVLALDLPAIGSVTGSDVYMTSAVTRTGSRAAFLVRTADGWRIAAAGCTPTVPDRPYDCELER